MSGIVIHNYGSQYKGSNSCNTHFKKALRVIRGNISSTPPGLFLASFSGGHKDITGDTKQKGLKYKHRWSGDTRQGVINVHYTKGGRNIILAGLS